MAESSTAMNDLVNRLSNISRLVEDAGDTRSRSNEQIDKNSSAYAKLQLYRSLADENVKVIDSAIEKQRKSLPIYKKKDELIKALQDNQILIIIGETGSGKTTQIPQYIVEAGLAISGKVGCTQLRRMAAKAVANRVAVEQGTDLGKEIGYTIRFEDMTSPYTKIQYMTDGILLRECICDKSLSTFSAIILDESHERTIDTDVLLAVLKQVSSRRNDLRLVISSATLDAEKFSRYFHNAAVFKISGRMFPVEIEYVHHYINDSSYIAEAVKTVIRINEKEKKGDILVFMSGEHDIENMVELLDDYRPSLYPQLCIIPVYSALPWESQALIFDKAEIGHRKVVIATNIAETSLTVDGIRYVIDTGYVKQKVYNTKKEMDVLQRVRISQAQAIQRTGRAGRLEPGKCFRLYTESEFRSMVDAPVPEISRSNLTSAVLLLKKMGYDIYKMDFLDNPPIETIDEAIIELILYQAIDSKGEITEIGHKMAGFPIEPNLAKMLITSEKLGCSEEILTIVAMLSVGDIFYRTRKTRQAADRKKAEFFTQYGDLVMLLEVYRRWTINNYEKKWCFEHFINSRMLDQAHQIREQLEEMLKKRNIKIVSTDDMVPVLKSICSGFSQNYAEKQSSFISRVFSYYTSKGEQVYIHPGSSQFRVVPQSVVYKNVTYTSKPFMRCVTPIQKEWLDEFLPNV